MTDIPIEPTNPTEVTAVVTAISYSGDIAIVAFEADGNNRFRLFGDKHLVAPIRHFVGEAVKVLITHQSEWSWFPIKTEIPHDVKVQHHRQSRSGLSIFSRIR